MPDHYRPRPGRIVPHNFEGLALIGDEPTKRRQVLNFITIQAWLLSTKLCDKVCNAIDLIAVDFDCIHHKFLELLENVPFAGEIGGGAGEDDGVGFGGKDIVSIKLGHSQELNIRKRREIEPIIRLSGHREWFKGFSDFISRMFYFLEKPNSLRGHH